NSNSGRFWKDGDERQGRAIRSFRPLRADHHTAEPGRPARHAAAAAAAAAAGGHAAAGAAAAAALPGRAAAGSAATIRAATIPAPAIPPQPSAPYGGGGDEWA